MLAVEGLATEALPLVIGLCVLVSLVAVGLAVVWGLLDSLEREQASRETLAPVPVKSGDRQ